MSQFLHTIQLPPATHSAAKLGRYLEITRDGDKVTNVSLPGSCSSYGIVLGEGEVVHVRLGYPTKDDSAAWDSLGWTPADKLTGGVAWPKGRSGSVVEQVVVKPHNGNAVKQATGVAVWVGDDCTEKPSEKDCTYPSCGCDVAERDKCGVNTTVPPVVEEPEEESAEIAPEADEFYSEVIEDEVDEVEDEISEDEVSEDEISEDEVQEEE